MGGRPRRVRPDDQLDLGLAALISRPEWYGYPAASWWPTLFSSRMLFDVVAPVYGLFNLGLAVVGAFAVIGRMRLRSGVDRAALRPGSIGVALATLNVGVAYVVQNLAPSNEVYAATTFAQGLALIVVDHRVRFPPDLVEASVSAAGLALENARLQADLRAQLTEVSSSRARILGAQSEERRRIERDLHDGAQQHLPALALRLEATRVRTREPATELALAAIRQELQAALQGVRDLAQGIHPALLAESGLAVALEPVVERLPLPVFVFVPPDRLDAGVETAAYFVICEALANVVKHAGAGSVRVSAEYEASSLRLRVVDDGAGTTLPIP